VKAIFADSFYFLALLRLDDRAHARALTASQNRSERLITTAWVLTEVADALAVPGMRESFPRLLAALRADPACMILPATQDLFDAGVELYARRPD
jgi:predicted nucleic acid-binding protein